MARPGGPDRVTMPAAPRVLAGGIAVLLAIVLVAVALRLRADLPNVLTGSVPPIGVFERRYAEHPWLAYGHIVPGVLYLLGAPLQLSARFRDRHPVVHRRLGRCC